MENEELMELCVKTWGKDAQLNQLQEELAELIVAVSKYRRFGEQFIDDMAEEIADIQIMVEQLSSIMKNDGHDSFLEKIEQWKAFKLKRLEGKLCQK